MTFEIFLNFNDGKCRAATEFYAAVFKSSVENITLFSDAPDNPAYPIEESERGRIMYATVKIADKNIMFMDMASSYPVVMGNNIMPAINVSDHAEIDRLFRELRDGGAVIMAPQKTFFSDYYTMLTDKFGITWQIFVP
ncbi:MAG: VOC family protein [Lactobacillaceae bacterium]|nr:VOC family protein [Lactobacillaceae bacterium]